MLMRMNSNTRPRGPRGRFVKKEKTVQPTDWGWFMQLIWAAIFAVCVGLSLVCCYDIWLTRDVIVDTQLRRDFLPPLE